MVPIEEKSGRFCISTANLDTIIEHNSAVCRDLKSELRLNHFGDLSSDDHEFKIKVLGHRGSPVSEGETTVIGRIENKIMDKLKSFTAPDSIDWYVFLF